MKKTRLLPIAAISLMISLVGCNWQIPENVSVKTNAEYEFSAGSFNKSLDEYLDVKKILDSNQDLKSKGIEIYDYFPGKADANVQKYLMKVPLAEVPLNFDDIMAKIDLTSGLDAMKVEKSFKVPSISIPPLTGITLNLENIEKTLNTALISVNNNSASKGDLYLPDVASKLESLIYTSGTMEIKGVAGVTVKIDLGSGTFEKDVTLKSVDGSSEGIGTINLAGKKIILANAKFEVIKPDLLPNEAYNFVAQIQTGAKINSIQNIANLGEITQINIPNNTKTIPSLFSASNLGIVNCTIGEGDIAFELNGITGATYSVTMGSTGGIKIDPAKEANKDNGHKLSLENAELNEGDSTLTVSGNISLAGANIDFTSNPQLVIKPEIRKLAKVTADVGTELKFNQSFPLPTEATSMLKSVGLNPSGVEITYTNGLPAGNNITLEAVSKFLNIGNTLTPAKATLVAQTEDTTSIKCAENTNIKIQPDSSVDFDVKVKLPGATETNPTYVTVSNVTSGATYNLALSFKPIIDWTTVTINPSAFPNLENQEINLGVNLNKMLSDLAKNLGDETGKLFSGIQLKDLPIYLFCTKPNLDTFNNIEFKGKAKLIVGTQEHYIVGSQAEDASISLVDKLPVLQKENDIVITDFSKLSDSEVSLKPTGVTEFVNTLISTPGDLKLMYGVNVTGASGKDLTIKRKDLHGTTTLGMTAYIDLGFALEVVNEDIDIDLGKMMGIDPTKDILDGNLKMMKDNGIDQYLEAIDEVAVNYNLKAIPYHSAPGTDIGIYVNIDGLDPINLGLHGGKIGITKEQILKLIDAPTPALKINKMGVTIPKGTFSIPRNKNICASLGARIATDGSIKLMENGKPLMGQSANAGGAK